MKVEVPCEQLTAQWNLGAWHLARHAVKNDKGQLRFNDHPYGILASETYLVLHALDLMGMHKEAADGLDQWLTLPMEHKIVPGKGGHHEWAKPDRPVGHFSDGRGCLTHAEGPGGVGGHMDGVHSMGPGAIMFAAGRALPPDRRQRVAQGQRAAHEGQRRVDPAAAAAVGRRRSGRRAPVVQGAATGPPGHARQRRPTHAVLRIGGLLLAGGPAIRRHPGPDRSRPKARDWRPRRRPIARI